MTEEMLLPHKILTVLSTCEATGYDITKELTSGHGYTWQGSHLQVYCELKKMAFNNLVAYKLEPQRNKPDRKVYNITSFGRELLLELEGC